MIVNKKYYEHFTKYFIEVDNLDSKHLNMRLLNKHILNVIAILINDFIITHKEFLNFAKVKE